MSIFKHMNDIWPLSGLMPDTLIRDMSLWNQEVDYSSTVSHTCPTAAYCISTSEEFHLASERKFQREGGNSKWRFKLSVHHWSSSKLFRTFSCVDYHSLDNTLWDTGALPKIQRWLALKSTLWVSSYSYLLLWRQMQVSECAFKKYVKRILWKNWMFCWMR